jgi:OmpA-OmpF porin, OOP family
VTADVKGVLRGGVCLWFGAALLTSAVSLGIAHAQIVSGFADDRFEPAGADSAWMTVESLDFDGHMRPAFALVGDWAWKPLVVYDGQGNEVAPLVRNQLVGHLDAALLLWNRLRVDLNLPVALVNSGDATLLGTQQFAAPDGAALGDIRLGADVVVFRRPDRQIVGAVGLQVFVPTGRTQAFNSDGGVRVWPRLAVAGDHGRFAWAGRVGVQIRPSDSCGCNLAPGTEVDGALAGGWRPRDGWLVGPELDWSHTIAGGTGALRSGTPLELLLGGHYAATPTWTFTAGLGHGLTDGAGTPELRLVAGAQYVFRPRQQAPRSE